MVRTFKQSLEENFSNSVYDAEGILDASYGKEYNETHEEMTFKNPQTIFADTRLKELFAIILQEAISLRTTDVQIMPQESRGIVRYRIGKPMKNHRILHQGAVESLITYMRMLVKTNPEGTKKPVSANYRFEYVTQDALKEDVSTFYDMRLEFLPSKFGTAASVRIFYPENMTKTIDDLGFPDILAMKYKEALKLSEGLIILSGATGSGKALCIETEIPMAIGDFKKLKDIKIGDVILDNKGLPTKVLNVFEHTNNDCYQITFSDGLTVVADSDHNWSVYEHLNTKKLLTTKELLSENLENYSVKNVESEIEYPSTEKSLSPYHLGKYIGKENKNSDKIICRLLKTENMTRRIPSDYLYGSTFIRKELLKGLLDEDGDSNLKGEVIYTSKYEHLIKDVKQLIESLGYITRPIKQTDENYSLLFYPHEEMFSSDVKNGRLNTHILDIFRGIEKIEKVESVPTKCLTVDSPENLFLCTRSYLVTHNTTTEFVGINQILQDTDFTANILTVESPIETIIEGVIQSEVNEAHGYDFASAVRSFLRMNPDVLLVGEVRDDETAKATTRAATSGHLTLTTIHANSTLEVLDVLKQYGVHPSDINQAVKLIIYQVLEEQLCPSCRKKRILTMAQKQWLDKKMLGKEQLTVVYEKNPDGCSTCAYQGVSGMKLMLAEMLSSSFEFRVLKDIHGSNIDALKMALINSEDSIYYPLEWDVHRRIKSGDIDFETAVRLIH